MCNSKDGTFQITAKHGPVSGRYRVQVEQVVDAVLRHAPSLDDARRFLRLTPDATNDVECVIGAETAHIELAIRSR